MLCLNVSKRNHPEVRMTWFEAEEIESVAQRARPGDTRKESFFFVLWDLSQKRLEFTSAP